MMKKRYQDSSEAESLIKHPNDTLRGAVGMSNVQFAKSTESPALKEKNPGIVQVLRAVYWNCLRG